MKHHGLQYKEEEDGVSRKGCISRLFSEQRKQIIKSVNLYGKKTHGGQIKIKRTAEEIRETGKTKRWKKGMTLGNFFTLDVGKVRKPSQVIQDAKSPSPKKRRASPSPKKRHTSPSPSPKKRHDSPSPKKPKKRKIHHHQRYELFYFRLLISNTNIFFVIGKSTIEAD